MHRWCFLISSLQPVPASTCCMAPFCTGAHPSKPLDTCSCHTEYQDGLFLPLEDAVLYWTAHRLSLSQSPFPWNSSTDLSCPITEIVHPLLVFSAACVSPVVWAIPTQLSCPDIRFFSPDGPGFWQRCLFSTLSGESYLPLEVLNHQRGLKKPNPCL